MSEKFGRAPLIAFSVSEEHIASGTSRNSNHCMIAEALKEKNPALTHIAVDIQTIRATDKEKGERYVWLTPRSCQQLIVDFDKGKKPKPFTVKIRDGHVLESGREYKRKKATQKLRKSRGGNNRTVPERVGGVAPPKSIGQRRSFGMRALQY